MPRDCGHKWLGCILSAEGSRGQHLDFDFHLQAASRAFFAHKAVLCNRKVSLKHRLRYFHAMVTPVACFGCGHRTIRKHHLEQLDIEFRKLVRRIVGPPVETDWAAPWHEVLHTWNERVQVQIQRAGIPIWSRVCLTQFGNLQAVLQNFLHNVGRNASFFGTLCRLNMLDWDDQQHLGQLNWSGFVATSNSGTGTIWRLTR